MEKIRDNSASSNELVLDYIYTKQINDFLFWNINKQKQIKKNRERA